MNSPANRHALSGAAQNTLAQPRKTLNVWSITTRLIGMVELLRSNDMVFISAVEALLKELDIVYFVADVHMSILEGSLGVLPRRIMVEEDRKEQAERALAAAGMKA